MTPDAVFFVFYIEGFLAVMTFTAEIAFVDLGHVHLVRPLRHLKYGVVTARALEAFVRYVFVVAEDYGAGILRRESDISSPDLFRERASWRHQAE